MDRHTGKAMTYRNAIAAFAGEKISVAVRWDDPFNTACNDYDLYLYDATGTAILAFSENVQDCSNGSMPVEEIQYVAPATGVD